MCVFACEICLKWPCVSSSLEGSRSCVETRPVSSLCSCCSVMLLALNTQTDSSMLTAGTTPHGNSQTFLKHCVCFFCPSLASKATLLQTFMGKQVDSVFKINSNTAMMQHSKLDHAGFNKKSKQNMCTKQNTAVFLCFFNWGQCLPHKYKQVVSRKGKPSI